MVSYKFVLRLMGLQGGIGELIQDFPCSYRERKFSDIELSFRNKNIAGKRITKWI